MNDDEKAENPERREALIRIGKYAAYTAPAMMVTIGTVRPAAAVPPAPTSKPQMM